MDWKTIGRTTLAGGAITGAALTGKAFVKGAAPALLKGKGLKAAAKAGASAVAERSREIALGTAGAAALCGAAESAAQWEEKRIKNRLD